MTERLNKRNAVIRYLLGVASERERNAVEEQYFADKARLAELLRAEDELIDDYVRGVLSSSDRRLFESHFLCTRDRRQRLETIKSFVEALAQNEYAERFNASEGISASFPPESRSGANHAESSQAAILHRSPTVDQFTALLRWLDSDRERAAEKYENIRHRLIRLFGMRGLNNAEELADETINRVAARSTQLFQTYIGDPAAYFYGVAKVVLRQASRQKVPVALVEVIASDESEPDQTYSCLEMCLQRLSESDRELILQYYQFGKEKKFDNREKLAVHLGISLNALRLRVHRVRQVLRDCITLCLQDTMAESDNAQSTQLTSGYHDPERKLE